MLLFSRQCIFSGFWKLENYQTFRQFWVTNCYYHTGLAFVNGNINHTVIHPSKLKSTQNV